MLNQEFNTELIHIYTVTELTRQIKTHIEREFDSIWVEGEISNIRIPSSGHLYFTLKDEESQIKAVMFKFQLRKIPFELQDGLSVICFGGISVYQQRGEYQVIVDYIEPKGIGALKLAYEQLKNNLYAEGLFDSASKKSLPLIPRRIGIVTSPTGAVIRDMLNIMKRRFPNIEVLLNPVRVQGDGAAQEIALAIEELNSIGGIDVIIVARGGGSLEDLWAFNEEVVARAIYNSKIPVISAVGHEVDYTIADFVADLRAPTPSAAAELVVRNKSEIQEEIESLFILLKKAIRKIFENADKYIKNEIRRIVDPRRRIQEKILKVEDLHLRIVNAYLKNLKMKNEGLRYVTQNIKYRHPGKKIIQYKVELNSLTKSLDATIRLKLRILKEGFEKEFIKIYSLNPLNILQRGYSIVRSPATGQIINEADRVNTGDKVNVRLWRGELICDVEKVIK